MPIAPFGDLQVGHVTGRDAQPVAVGHRLHRGRAEQGALFRQAAHQPVGHLGHLLSGKEPEQLVDLRALFQESFLVALGQAACHENPPQASLLFELAHFVNRVERFLPGAL